MSSQWSLPGWGSRNAKSEEASASATNGVVGDTAAADAVTAPDGTGAASSQPDGAAPVAAETREAAQVEPAAETSAPVASDPAPATGGDGTNGETPAVVEDGPAFMAKLARAMHTTAARERARIADDVERRRAAHVQAVRDRAASEVERIRALAGDDMKAIEAWAAGEANRVKLEREQREKALNEDLEVSLKEHRSIIDREVADAETAIAAYRTEVEAFFADLDREADPIEIARQAGRHPVFPTLAPTTGVGADASQAAGPAVVGVMGVPSASGRAEPGAALPGSSSLLIGVPASDGGAGRDDAREPVGVIAGSGGSAAGTADTPLDSLLSPRSER